MATQQQPDDNEAPLKRQRLAHNEPSLQNDHHPLFLLSKDTLSEIMLFLGWSLDEYFAIGTRICQAFTGLQMHDTFWPRQIVLSPKLNPSRSQWVTMGQAHAFITNVMVHRFSMHGLEVLSSIPSLKKVFLSHCRLKFAGLLWLRRLRLASLGLSKCTYLRDKDLAWIGRQAELRHLSLQIKDVSHLTDIPIATQHLQNLRLEVLLLEAPSAFFGPILSAIHRPSIKRLILYLPNDMKTEPSFKGFSGVEFLTVKNLVTNQLLEAFENLVYLNLMGAQWFYHNALEYITQNTKLKYLRFRTAWVDLEPLMNLRVTHLQICINRLELLGDRHLLSHLQRMPCLKHLSILACLHDDDLGDLLDTKLTSLAISGNITDAGLAIISSLTSLQELTLASSEFTFDGLRFLERMPNLRSVELRVPGSEADSFPRGRYSALDAGTWTFLRGTSELPDVSETWGLRDEWFKCE